MLSSVMERSGSILTVVGEAVIGAPTEGHFLTPNNDLAWKILSNQALYNFSGFPLKVKSVFLETSFRMGGQHLSQGLEMIGVYDPIVPLALLPSLIAYHEKVKASGKKPYPALLNDEGWFLREDAFEKNYLFIEGGILLSFCKGNECWLVDADPTTREMKLKSRGRVYCT